MFSALLIAGSCHKFKKVTALTDRNFKKYVDNRNESTVYFVMFHGDHCPACQMAYPEFQAAAYNSGGMIKFGNVDTSYQQQLASRFQIMGIPTFIVFHSKGQTNYQGPRTARHFLNFGSKFIPPNAQEINSSWLPAEDTKEAILFTSRRKAPAIWNAIASFFKVNTVNESKIQIGYTNDPKMMKEFHVIAQPTILMINGNVSREYTGKSNYSILRKTLVDFYNGKMPKEPVRAKPTPAPVIIGNITSMESFNEKCKGHSTFCVVQKIQQADETFKELAKRFRRDPFKFVICGDKCPLKIPDGVSVFHKSRPQFFTTTIDQLAGELDRIIDGTASSIWKNYPQESEL